jgi:hypothetical protein
MANVLEVWIESLLVEKHIFIAVEGKSERREGG